MKNLNLFLVFCTVCFVQMQVQAGEWSERRYFKTSGYGEWNVWYEYNYSTQTLWIGGEGPMPDSDQNNSRWWDYAYWYTFDHAAWKFHWLIDKFIDLLIGHPVKFEPVVWRNTGGHLDNTYAYPIRHLYIEKGITHVGAWCFQGLQLLETVEFEYRDHVSIGANAFNGCSKLTSLKFPYSMKSISIGNEAFKNCTGLKSVELSTEKGVSNAVTIGKAAFQGCSDMTDFSGDAEVMVTEIADNTFNGCSKLAHCYIAQDIKRIGDGAFYGCAGLTSINIPATVTSIGAYAFAGSGLTSVTLSNNLKNISDGAFADCTGLTFINIPATVTNIGAYAFAGSGLTSATVGSGDIGNFAFADCTGLTSVTVGSDVNSIGYSAFAGCTRLASFTNSKPVPQNIQVLTFDRVNLNGVTLYVPAKSDVIYTSTIGWMYFGRFGIIGSNVTREIPQSITLDKSSAVLPVGTSETLTAIFSPSHTTSNVIWSSTNPLVATVSANGEVSAIAPGEATIVATSVYGSKIATCPVTVIAHVASVSLNKSATTMLIRTSEILTVTVSPPDAINKEVTWSSSNPDVANVSNGVVTTNTGAGEAIITAATANGKKADCKVTVTIPAAGIHLNKSSVTLSVNSSETLMATVSPSDAVNKEVTWSSSNPEVATVSNGVVTAKAAGEATITATMADGKKADCTVTVIVPATDVILNKSSVTLSVNSSETLTATVFPPGATKKEVIWSSSNPVVATVSDGIVTAKSAGVADITVTTATEGKQAACQVTVPVPVTSVSFRSPAEFIVGMSAGLTATVLPPNAANKAVTWSSINPEVATVSDDGEVTANAAGTTFIKVKTKDGGKTDSCEINVRTSSDATLSSLTYNGSSVPEFDPGITDYMVTVENSIRNITINAEASYRTVFNVSGDIGKHPISVGENIFNVTVTFEGIPMKTYRLNVKRLSNDATLSNLTYDGSPIPGFDPACTEYTIAVGSDITNVDTKKFECETSHPAAKASMKYDALQYLFTIHVTAEDNATQIYRIRVTRLGSDATLYELIFNGSRIMGFSPATTDCTFAVPNEVTNIYEIIPKTSCPTASAVVEGSTRLNVGDNPFKITVTAEDGFQQVYLVNARRLSNDATLSSLTFNGTDVEEFQSDIFDYSFVVNHNVTSVSIGATANYAKAGVSGEGSYPVSVGVNSFPITVVSEDLTDTTEYIVTVKRLNGNTSLKEITVNDQNVVATNDSNYTIAVESDVKYITINAIATCQSAVISGDVGRRWTNVGDNIFTFTVTAEDTTIKQIYNLNVRRMSDDVSLETVTVNGTVISNDTITVDHSVSMATIAAKATHGLASVEGNGTYSLNFGTNIFPIFVTAEDTTQKQSYIITITRASLPFVEFPTTPTTIGINNVDGQDIKVYTSNNVLYASSPVAETVNIYTVTGKLLYSIQKPAGETALTVNHSKGILIIRGGSGWIKKLMFDN
ncbi:MAG: leucine-rich repeat protein [Dysgonamonadaceae bacterium]|jgi:uncharacterized protein YjdB|nr:leucine-rich repeat protein [Dysgonamonadaceae bacterium]